MDVDEDEEDEVEMNQWNQAGIQGLRPPVARVESGIGDLGDTDSDEGGFDGDPAARGAGRGDREDHGLCSGTDDESDEGGEDAERARRQRGAGAEEEDGEEDGEEGHGEEDEEEEEEQQQPPLHCYKSFEEMRPLLRPMSRTGSMSADVYGVNDTNGLFVLLSRTSLCGSGNHNLLFRDAFSDMDMQAKGVKPMPSDVRGDINKKWFVHAGTSPDEDLDEFNTVCTPAGRPCRSTVINIPECLQKQMGVTLVDLKFNSTDGRIKSRCAATSTLLAAHVYATSQGEKSGRHAEIETYHAEIRAAQKELSDLQTMNTDAETLKMQEQKIKDLKDRKLPPITGYNYFDRKRSKEHPRRMFVHVIEPLYDKDTLQVIGTRLWKLVYDDMHSDSKLLARNFKEANAVDEQARGQRVQPRRGWL